jgi:hypothetical protein
MTIAEDYYRFSSLSAQKKNTKLLNEANYVCNHTINAENEDAFLNEKGPEKRAVRMVLKHITLVLPLEMHMSSRLIAHQNALESITVDFCDSSSFHNHDPRVERNRFEKFAEHSPIVQLMRGSHSADSFRKLTIKIKRTHESIFYNQWARELNACLGLEPTRTEIDPEEAVSLRRPAKMVS